MLILLADVLTLMYVFAPRESTRDVITVQCYVLVCMALIVMLVRVWNFKYYLLHPVVGIWGDADTVQGAVHLGLSFAAGVGGVIFMMFTGVVVSQGDTNTGVGLAIGTTIVFLLASLF